MVIGGLEKLTLLDYPDYLAAVIFTQGCNFRCHFCYNPSLVLTQNDWKKRAKKNESLSVDIDELFVFLQERFGKLEGVVISGGEPTLHADLPEFIKKIKEIGYRVKLDTNGTNPQMLLELLKNGLIDYLAMDLKAPLKKYDHTAGVKVDCQKIRKSVKIIMASGLPYEFRTTVVPDLLTVADIEEMGQLIKGADKWYLQKIKSDTPLVNDNFQNVEAYSNQQMDDLVAVGSLAVKFCALRV